MLKLCSDLHQDRSEFAEALLLEVLIEDDWHWMNARVGILNSDSCNVMSKLQNQQLLFAGGHTNYWSRQGESPESGRISPFWQHRWLTQCGRHCGACQSCSAWFRNGQSRCQVHFIQFQSWSCTYFVNTTHMAQDTHSKILDSTQNLSLTLSPSLQRRSQEGLE